MQDAFSTRLSRYRSPHGEYRGRSGHLHVPAKVAPAIEAVLGLDNRPQATADCRAVPREHAEEARRTSFTPSRVAQLYEFPRRLDGSGQRIAVLELGGGFRRASLRRYFAKIGKPMPSIAAVSVDGVRNRPGVSHGADGEVVLDVEVIGAIAPGAEQLVYFAPASDRGFLDAVTTALFDPRGPSILSISWGQAEDEWTEQGRHALDQAFRAAALLGITVCAASGDNGWSGRPHRPRGARRLSGLEPARPRLRRHAPRGDGRGHRRGRMERPQRELDRRRRERALRRCRRGRRVRGFHAPSTRAPAPDAASRTSPGTRIPIPATWWATA